MPPFDSKDYAFIDVPKVCLETINQNVIDWTQDQEDIQIHAENYTNTTYALASEGNAGLSKYNFSLDRRNKLIGIQTGAEVNINSDWDSQSGKSQILNKPTIVDWTQEYSTKIHQNNIPNLPYVKEISFNNLKSSVDSSFNKVDTSINNIKLELSNLDSSFNTFKSLVDSSFIIIDSSLDNIIVDLSNLDFSFNTFKSSVELSFNKVDSSLSNLDISFNTFKLSVENSFNLVDLSLDKIINDISRLDFSVNSLPDFVDWTIEQTDDIHINNIPALPYATEVSLNNVILDLSNLDNSFNSFKGLVEASFNIVDLSLDNIIQDISNLDNSFNTFKLSVENSFNLVDLSLIDIIQDISILDFSFASLSRVFDRVIVIEASLNDIIDDIDDILPDINSNNLAYVLTSTGSTAVWSPVITLNTNDTYIQEATTGTAASTLGVFNYAQPKIINLDVCDNNYIEISGADFIVNGDSSLNGILNISGSVFLNGVNLMPNVTGDVTLDASYVNVDVCLNVPHIASGIADVYMEFSTRDNNNVINLVAADFNTGLRYIEIKDDMLSARRFAPFGNVPTDLILNNDGGNVTVQNNLSANSATITGNMASATASTTGSITVGNQLLTSSIRLNSSGTRDALYKYINANHSPHMYVGDVEPNSRWGFDFKFNWGAQNATNTLFRAYLGGNSTNRSDGWFQVFCNAYNLKGTWHSSDDRYKHGEINIENGLETIRQLVPKTYKKTENNLGADNDGTNIGIEDKDWWYESGLIAQEIEKIPTLTEYVVDVDGYKCVKYNDIHCHTIAGLKELDAIVTAQAELITKLENRITILENS